MKRVFILNDKVKGGGAEIVMRDIINHLHGKYDLTVMTFDDDVQAARDVFPEDVEYIPAKIRDNPYGRKNPLHYLYAIYSRLRGAYIRRKKYDIVIANKEGPCMIFAAKMKASRKLAWIHADYRYVYWTKNCFKAGGEVKCMRRFDQVVCVSEAAREGVKSLIGDPGNLCVAYNPIDYRSIRKNALAATPIERNKNIPLFVSVGRVVKQKNYLTLAKVCARLSRVFAFELWIVGDGAQRAEIESFLKQEDCSCVKILGMQDNPYQYLSKADCFVNSSLGESYCLVIQEALVLGVPVLTTRCPAIEESCDTKFGMIVDCDEASIENGLRRILEDPNCLDSYRKRITAEYAAEELWEKRLDWIEELVRG